MGLLEFSCTTEKTTMITNKKLKDEASIKKCGIILPIKHNLFPVQMRKDDD